MGRLARVGKVGEINMNMPHIWLTRNLQPESGDLLLVDPSTWISGIGIKLLSRGQKRCYTYHAGIIADKSFPPNGITVPQCLNVHWPKATVENLYSYLAAVKMNCGKYVIARPTWVVEAEPRNPELVREWRKCIDSMVEQYRGMAYPAWDIWVILKRMTWLHKILPFTGTRWEDYCVEAVSKIYKHNAARSWLPEIVQRQELPASIHYEIAAAQGHFELVAEHPLGLWREITAS